ncbi:MAG TPA: STAS domain-containing protein [Tepidisphaeraceae bacterium]|nr:STAS domain-containing protein [Tepidisphaeraceae bacterium]
MSASNSDLPFNVQPIKDVSIVEFRDASLMDPVALDRAAERLYAMIEKEDRRKIILDFSAVQYMSSQSIGIVMNMQKKLTAIKGSMILCGVGPKLQELLKLTRLDKILTIKPSQREAQAHYNL